MHLELRSWQFTRGVRSRIFYSMIIGLLSSGFGVARLALLGWLIGKVFNGAIVMDLLIPSIAIITVMIVRGILEHFRTMIAHNTAAQVQ